jgi:hypothetical protein
LGTLRDFLSTRTQYDIAGKLDMLHKALLFTPAQLSKHLNELEYLAERLEKAEAPVQVTVAFCG